MYGAANDGCADRLALASLMTSAKPSKRAVERCRKRMSRAVAVLVTARPQLGAPDPCAAIEAIRRSCQQCGRCDGI